MSGAVLLTGATGFLGMDILARLIEGERQVIVLVRARDRPGAAERLAGVLAQLYERIPGAAARVRAIAADLEQPGLGLAVSDRDELLRSVAEIVHCAASISFDLELERARAINVHGVGRLMELAREIAAKGSLQRLLHVSTAYVCGRHGGVFYESELELSQRFRNTYERSKQEAEKLLAGALDLPVVVVRPSIVVGHRASGWTSAFNVIYWPMRAYERGLLEEVPARADSIVDFVPVDYVTDAILHLLAAPGASGTYHLVAGQQALSLGELARLQAGLLDRPPVRLLAAQAPAQLLQGAEQYLPYLDVRCRFDEQRARHALLGAGIASPAPSEYLARLIEYAQRTRWGKRPLSRQAAFAGWGAA